MDNRELRHLGRLPFPMLRERGERGFRRITWDAAYKRIARESVASIRGGWRFSSPRAASRTRSTTWRKRPLVSSARTTSITRAPLPFALGAAMKAAIGVGRIHLQLQGLVRLGSDRLLRLESRERSAGRHEVSRAGQGARDESRARESLPRAGDAEVLGALELEERALWHRARGLLVSVAQAGDIAFIYGVLKILIANDGINREFVEQHTQDWDRSAAGRVARLAEIERQAGTSACEHREFAALLRDAKNAVFVWSMGITQHHFGGDAVQMV
jgi:hypothetical protein